MHKFVTTLILTLFLSSSVAAEDQTLTIIHTNDLHSHLLGFSTNADYTPLTTGDDDTIGGWARIATVINEIKEARDNPVLVLDAGDFLMGSAFHLISREEAVELALMHEMGVEVTTIGNHEFDLKPVGLARIIGAAAENAMPKIVASNLQFDVSDPGDDQLAELMKAGLINPYTVIEKGGVKIGIFGLMGHRAVEASPFASPVTFADPLETARSMVAKLRNDEGVDVVICLSHSGLDEDPEKSEDLILAREVNGIDVVVSSHTDTILSEPIVENETLIVHALGYGKRVGVLDLAVSSSGVSLSEYEYIEINDTIAGDPRMDGLVGEAVDLVNQQALQPYGLTFDQVIAETSFNLTLNIGEANLGNLVTDAYLWAANEAEYDPSDPASRGVIALLSNGVIRDNILSGKTGQQAVSDLFRVAPLGIGVDGSLAYPLVSIYMTGAEIKKSFEIMTSLPNLKGDEYYIQVAGAKVTYNPNRMIFDRVTEIKIDDGSGQYIPLDTSKGNPQTYKVVSDIYNATFLKVIGDYTMGILNIVPKDMNGNPIDDLALTRLDADPDQEGIQEVKNWTSLIGYVQTFEDTNGNGTPDFPDRYAALEGRQVVDASLNPVKLLAGGNYLTWLAAGLIVVALLLVFLIMRFVARLFGRLRT